MTEENREFRVRTPKGNEVFGLVEANLGASRFRVRCQDNKVRICRIPGKYKRRLWVKEDAIVIVQPWDIQGDEKGDLIWRYTNTQANWLRKKNLLDF